MSASQFEKTESLIWMLVNEHQGQLRGCKKKKKKNCRWRIFIHHAESLIIRRTLCPIRTAFLMAQCVLVQIQCAGEYEFRLCVGKHFFLVEFDSSAEGIWKQITRGHAAASPALWLSTVAVINTNVPKVNVCLQQMGNFSWLVDHNV